jgi:hypothetical protein
VTLFKFLISSIIDSGFYGIREEWNEHFMLFKLFTVFESFICAMYHVHYATCTIITHETVEIEKNQIRYQLMVDRFSSLFVVEIVEAWTCKEWNMVARMIYHRRET